MKNCIAERRLILEVIETGERRNLTIRVGIPYLMPGGKFAFCPREYEGLFESVADASGMDMVQALNLASDVDSMLKNQTNKYRFYWPGGEPYFDE
jgi:hypothetical protein